MPEKPYISQGYEQLVVEAESVSIGQPTSFRLKEDLDNGKLTLGPAVLHTATATLHIIIKSEKQGTWFAE